MSISSRDRMRLGFVLAYSVLIIVAVILYLLRPATPPLIQGVLLADPRPLDAFELIDHHTDTFSNSDLSGHWHMVSYGFTTCPDVCPATLAVLAQMTDQLQPGEDLRVLFYSVDHRRDTAEQLSSYLPFFNQEFTGLTHLDNPDNPHLPFEQSLGIASRLEPIIDEQGVLDPDNYRVIHGVNLLLLNPHGELQAIFKPTEVSPGIQGFDVQQLLKDFRAVRNYAG